MAMVAFKVLRALQAHLVLLDRPDPRVRKASKAQRVFQAPWGPPDLQVPKANRVRLALKVLLGRKGKKATQVVRVLHIEDHGPLRWRTRRASW